MKHKDLVELGSGADRKISILLEAAGRETRSTLRYIPVDISDSAITNSSLNLKTRYPELKVMGIVADFTSRIEALPADRPTMFFFLGSTIGNFDEFEGSAFLRNIAAAMKPEDTLLIGFDMIKPFPIIEAAYNDAQGVTAEFNKNILRVVNKELKADFNPSCFDHLAFFNENYSRIEMHLKANRDLTVRIESLNTVLEIKEGRNPSHGKLQKIHQRDYRAIGRPGRLDHSGLVPGCRSVVLSGVDGVVKYFLSAESPGRLILFLGISSLPLSSSQLMDSPPKKHLTVNKIT